MKVGDSKISQRGSVVVPKSIREALNLNEGDFLEWHINAPREGAIIISVVKKEGR